MLGIREVIRRVTDQAKRSRLGWMIVCWALAGLMFVFGIGYVIGGVGATSSPGAYIVLTRWVAGDLHTYGAVMLLLSLALIHGLLPALHGEPIYDQWLRRVIIVVGAFCFLLVWMFAWSWALSGVKTWQAMAYWASQSGVALGLLIGQQHRSGNDDPAHITDGRQARA